MSVSQINYERLGQQLSGLIGGEDDQIANLANCAALLWLEIHKLDWILFSERRSISSGSFSRETGLHQNTHGSGRLWHCSSDERDIGSC
jgi:putative methionine-R-sulfoxide reductase with GAF domain